MLVHLFAAVSAQVGTRAIIEMFPQAPQGQRRMRMDGMNNEERRKLSFTSDAAVGTCGLCVFNGDEDERKRKLEAMIVFPSISC